MRDLEVFFFFFFFFFFGACLLVAGTLLFNSQQYIWSYCKAKKAYLILEAFVRRAVVRGSRLGRDDFKFGLYYG